MKSFLKIAALAALVVSCASEERDYKDLIKKSENKFEAKYEELSKDTTIPSYKKDSILNAEWDIFIEEVGAITAEALKKHNDDDIAVDMILTMDELEITDEEGIVKAIEKLGPKAKSNKKIQKLLASHTSKIETSEGSHFVDFSIAQPDGSVKKLSDYAGNGKYCIVDFWASWCGPCKREIPYLQEVYKKYGKKINMVSVAVWDDAENTISAAKELGIKWNQIINAQHIPTDLYGIQGIPQIMLIGPDGTILKRDMRGEGIAEELRKHL